MLKITLHKSDAPSYRAAVLQLPEQENILAEKLEQIGVGITAKQNCLVDQVDGDGGALQRLVGQCVNADELQFLAKRLDSFDKHELLAFRAAVTAEDLAEVGSMINLTFNLHAYTVISDFSDVGSIGRTHLMTMRGAMSTDEMEKIDFEKTGRQLIADGAAIVTPYGVLYENGAEQELVYDGWQFPEYFYKPAFAEVTLSPDKAFRVTEHLYLPCWDVEIKKALNRLGVESPSGCFARLELERPGILEDGKFSTKIINLLTKDFPLAEHLDTLNALCRSYQGFDDRDLDNFNAIIEWAEPRTPEELKILADNYYEITVIPGVHSDAEYGRHMIMESGRYEYDPELENYIDFDLYGSNRVQKEKGDFTPYGYLAYTGTSPEMEEILSRCDTPGMEMGGLS